MKKKKAVRNGGPGRRDCCGDGKDPSLCSPNRDTASNQVDICERSIPGREEPRPCGWNALASSIEPFLMATGSLQGK